MDRFKNKIENVLFSNKTHFIKNRRQGYNSNTSNISSNSNSSSNPFEGEYTDRKSVV